MTVEIFVTALGITVSVYCINHGSLALSIRWPDSDRNQIGGQPLDINRTYKMATIDFLMDGGDGVSFTKCAMNKIETGILIRDAIVDYIRQMNAEGKVLRLVKDGRVIINE